MFHVALPLIIALLGPSDVPPSPLFIPEETPQAAGRELRPDFTAGDKCHDNKLPAAGNPSRQPRFERGPATTDMGQFIYAVDRRIDGCSVDLVMSPGIQPRGRLQLTPEQMAQLRGRR